MRGDSVLTRTTRYSEEEEVNGYMSGGSNGRKSREVKIISYPRAQPIVANWNLGPVHAHKFTCDFDESALLNRKQFTVSDDNELNEYERKKQERLRLSQERDQREAEERERRRLERLEADRLAAEKAKLEQAEWD